MINNLLIILAFTPAVFILYAINRGWTDKLTNYFHNK